MPFDLSVEQTRQQGGKRILRFAKCKTYWHFRQTLFLIFFEFLRFFFLPAPPATPGRRQFADSPAPRLAPRCRCPGLPTVSISVGRPVWLSNKYQVPVKSFNDPPGRASQAVYAKKNFRLIVQNNKNPPNSSAVPISSRIPIALTTSSCSPILTCNS